MKTIDCEGSPSEIGFQYGQAAAVEIKRTLVFYEGLLKSKSKFSWDRVCHEALRFLPLLQKSWPQYVQEIDASSDLINLEKLGFSRGSGFPFDSILALNVRTEIAYGMFDDGCTALSWKTDKESYLAQNWDWQLQQAENLVHLRIRQVQKPSIEIVSEAGLIGKIGLNSAGVGVCLNAIRARGVDFQKLPCHLALRACLDSHSKDQATEILKDAGVASSCHILLADPTGGVGLECSHNDLVEIVMDDRGIVRHTNHYTKDHPLVEENIDLPDSIYRLQRITDLTDSSDTPSSIEAIAAMLKDEHGYPVSICRAQTEKSMVATLFSIVMELNAKLATVTIGRPVDGEETIFLKPS
ncbi:hypothetical protein MMC13_008126 [Lambiella insularis]|nr:hypothetical protein [Lambiella insularis]